MRIRLLTRLLILIFCGPAFTAAALPEAAVAGAATEVTRPASAQPTDTSRMSGGEAEHLATAAPIEERNPAVPVLTLAQAIERALAAHHGLAALEKEYWALDSEAWQAGRRPNPELELELEEFGGTAEARGVRALATSLTYTQPLERGGKRARRETAASLEREVVLWDVAELEHEIQAGVRTAYAAAQAEQYALVVLEQYRQLVQQIYTAVELQVEAGRSARLELERLDVELARLDLEIDAARRNVGRAQLELAGQWGATSVDFAAVVPVTGAGPSVPSLELLMPLLAGHPAVSRFDAEYDALCAAVDLEHANAVPDLAVFGGLTRLNETEETVFKVGLAVDLPLHDRNEGNISAAGYRLERVADNRAAARRALETSLATLQQQAAHADENHRAYGASLLPAAREALALTQEGYRYGKFQLLDVLDAQRTVLEIEGDQAAALLELHAALAGIEALLNTDLAPSVSVEAEAGQMVTQPPHEDPAVGGIEEHHHD